MRTRNIGYVRVSSKTQNEARQIAAARPKQLVIFDIYENNAYQIEQELKRKYPDLDIEALIGSVRNTDRINDVLRKYKPDIIFHAAAHKHVPLMEKSPNEAVKNNVMGTYKTALAAVENDVKRFVLISTDKAVNPTSLMGATKRICEMIIQMMARKYPKTVFSAVDIVGDGNKVLISEMKAFVQDNNLSASVVFHGKMPMDEIADFYRSCGVMLFTSKMEGYPMVVLESKAYGIPLVMYDMPYLSLTKDGLGILTAPLGNIEAMAENIKSLLTNNTLYTRMAQEARQCF